MTEMNGFDPKALAADYIGRVFPLIQAKYGPDGERFNPTKVTELIQSAASGQYPFSARKARDVLTSNNLTVFEHAVFEGFKELLHSESARHVPYFLRRDVSEGTPDFSTPAVQPNWNRIAEDPRYADVMGPLSLTANGADRILPAEVGNESAFSVIRKRGLGTIAALAVYVSPGFADSSAQYTVPLEPAASYEGSIPSLDDRVIPSKPLVAGLDGQQYSQPNVAQTGQDTDPQALPPPPLSNIVKLSFGEAHPGISYNHTVTREGDECKVTGTITGGKADLANVIVWANKEASDHIVMPDEYIRIFKTTTEMNGFGMRSDHSFYIPCDPLVIYTAATLQIYQTEIELLEPLLITIPTLETSTTIADKEPATEVPKYEVSPAKPKFVAGVSQYDSGVTAYTLGVDKNHLKTGLDPDSLIERLRTQPQDLTVKAIPVTPVTSEILRSKDGEYNPIGVKGTSWETFFGRENVRYGYGREQIWSDRPDRGGGDAAGGTGAGGGGTGSGDPSGHGSEGGDSDGPGADGPSGHGSEGGDSDGPGGAGGADGGSDTR